MQHAVRKSNILQYSITKQEARKPPVLFELI